LDIKGVDNDLIHYIDNEIDEEDISLRGSQHRLKEQNAVQKS